MTRVPRGLIGLFKADEPAAGARDLRYDLFAPPSGRLGSVLARLSCLVPFAPALYRLTEPKADRPPAGARRPQRNLIVRLFRHWSSDHSDGFCEDARNQHSPGLLPPLEGFVPRTEGSPRSCATGELAHRRSPPAWGPVPTLRVRWLRNTTRCRDRARRDRRAHDFRCTRGEPRRVLAAWLRARWPEYLL